MEVDKQKRKKNKQTQQQQPHPHPPKKPHSGFQRRKGVISLVKPEPWVLSNPRHGQLFPTLLLFITLARILVPTSCLSVSWRELYTLGNESRLMFLGLCRWVITKTCYFPPLRSVEDIWWLWDIIMAFLNIFQAFGSVAPSLDRSPAN